MIIHPASSSPTALGGGNTTAPTLCQALPVPLLRESISQLARPQRRHLFLVHVTDVQTEAPAPGTRGAQSHLRLPPSEGSAGPQALRPRPRDHCTHLHRLPWFDKSTQ